MKRQRQIEKELDLPSEIWYSIFRLLGDKWCLLTPFQVSHKWTKVIQDEHQQHVVSIRNRIIPPPHILLERVPKIRVMGISIYNSKLDQHYFEKLTGIQSLSLINGTHRGCMDDYVGLLTSLVNLTKLDTNWSHTKLPLATGLKTLTLVDRDVNSKEIDVFLGLESLSLTYSHGLTSDTLRKLTNLKRLNLNSTESYDSDVLSYMPNLLHLSMHFSNTIKNETLSSLTALQSLMYGRYNEYLNLNGDGEDEEVTTKTPLLRYLSTSLRNLTLVHATSLYEERITLPSLCSLNITGSLHVNKEMLSRMPSLKSLRCEKLSFERDVKTTDITHLTKMEVGNRIDYCANGGLLDPSFDVAYFYLYPGGIIS